MADSQVQQVKAQTDILQLIGERVQIKKSGRSFKGLCPFHGEKTPSFFVSPELQTFKCFGCGEHGDVISFVQKYEGLTFPEALESLAERAGIELEHRGISKEDSKRKRSLELLQLASEYYAYLLTSHKVGKQGLAYLRGRNVTNQSIQDFRLGYSLDSWEAMQHYLVKRKGFHLKELIEVGLVIPSSRGGYDRFRGRVMFPLRTYAGKVVGFSGRLLDTEAKEAKYINTPETPYYHKRELLFGMSLAKKAIREQDRVVVVEGEMDVISSFQAGAKETVAVKGSALTEQHVQLIRRLTRNMVLALDADQAGQEAILKGIKLAEEQGMNMRVIQLVGGKDPDELIRSSATTWKNMIRSAVSVYQYYIDLALARHDASTGQGQKQITQMIAPVFSKIENKVERSFYVRKLADVLGVNADVLDAEIVRVGMTSDKKAPSSTRVDEKATRTVGRRERLERYVLSLLFQFERNLEQKLAAIDVAWFSEAYLRRLVEALLQLEIPSGGLHLDLLKTSLSEELMSVVHDLYAADEALLQMNRDELGGLFEKACGELRKLYLTDKLSILTKRLSTHEGTEAELKKLQADYRALSSQLYASN